VAEQLPTKTITAPDGSQIHYPNLPGVGEPYQPPRAAAHEAHGQQSAQPPAQAPIPPVGNESWRERVINAARSAVERVSLYGHAAVNALVLDDWKALTDAHSSTLQRIEGGASLASWAIPEGKVAEIAGHALVKASEVAAAHLAASGVEHAGSAAATRSLSRPLTEAERTGHFKSVDDFKKFMGPATEPGGPANDWHHVVEKIHADKYGRFPAEQIHSTENIVPVPRGPHQGEDGLTAAFNKTDRRLGTSVRERLQGRPWEEHVDRGEQELRRQGLDPDALRAETRTRFEQRLIEHDRAHALSQEYGVPKIERDRTHANSHEHGVPQIAAPGLVLGTIGPGSQLKNADVTQGHSLGDHQHAAGSHPELHVFRNGESQTPGVGDHLTGKVFNYGRLIGMQEDASVERGLTMFGRQELFDITPPEQRAALGKALHDGNTLEVGIGSKGATAHVTATRQLIPEIEQSRAREQQQGRGLER